MQAKSQGKGIGGHARPNGGTDETWLTPPEILWALGEFDLDPCAAPSPRPWPTAKRHVEPPEDGLPMNWYGRVWLNPPYGDKVAAWMQKMSEYRCGTALIFARTETEVWHRYVWSCASGILFFSGRLYFHFPDGTRAAGNAGGPSALIAYGKRDAEILEASGITGAFVNPRNKFTTASA